MEIYINGMCWIEEGRKDPLKIRRKRKKAGVWEGRKMK